VGKIVNRRNAAFGWFVWRMTKYVIREKTKRAVPHVEAGRPNKAALFAGLAAIAGAILVWRKVRNGDGDAADAAEA
jgi:hypothetical protein